MRAYSDLRAFRGSGAFAHWLHAIAVRTGYGHWRGRAAGPAALDDALLERLAEAPGTDASEAGELVHRALGLLPPRDRLVLTLMYLDGNSVAEIAELTGWSAVMVKVQAWRARGKLKKALGRLDPEEGHGRALGNA